MEINLKIFAISGIIFFLIDSVFLSIISKKYGEMIKKIQNKPMKVRILSAVVCYALLIFSLNYFILSNDENQELRALFLGWTIYGVYDSTAYALIENWDIKMALIDGVWGGILFYLSTISTKFVLKNLLKNM